MSNIEITYRNIINENFDSALKVLSSLNVSLKESLALIRLEKLITIEKEIFNSQKIKYCDLYGSKNEEGTSYNFPLEIRDLVTLKLNELFDSKFETDLKVKIKIPPGSEISSDEILLLEEIIDCDFD